MTLPAIKSETITDLDADTLAKLVADGDCKRLTAEQRVAYYRARCDAAGLDYRTQPFEFLTLNNRLVLYARKECAAQLTRLHQLSHEVLREEVRDDIYRVWARAKEPGGRFTDDLGAVSVKGLTGDARCNAELKCVTKAKRRATLSHCGLGELDETEVETIPNAKRLRMDEQGELTESVVTSTASLQPPRRLSEREAEPTLNADEINLEPASPEASRYFTHQELGSLFASLRENGIDEACFKAWAKASFGVKSRKELRIGWLGPITEWIGQQTKGED